MAVTLTDTSRNVMVTAFTDQLDGGHILIKNAAAANLAILVFHATTPFTTAASGSQEAGGTGEEITPEDSVLPAASTDGTATNFSLTDPTEATVYATGTVTINGGGGDIEFTPTNVFVETGTVSISSMIVTVPATCA